MLLQGYTKAFYDTQRARSQGITNNDVRIKSKKEEGKQENQLLQLSPSPIDYDYSRKKKEKTFCYTDMHTPSFLLSFLPSLQPTTNASNG